MSELGMLLDSEDALGWDRAKHGRMVEVAAPDDAVETVEWTPEMGEDF